jgi:hypothetical protein
MTGNNVTRAEVDALRAKLAEVVNRTDAVLAIAGQFYEAGRADEHWATHHQDKPRHLRVVK